MSTAAQTMPEPVLLVVDDDEELVCRLTARTHRMRAFMSWRPGGAEALSLLATSNGTVQLVVSDSAMPGVVEGPPPRGPSKTKRGTVVGPLRAGGSCSR